MINELRNFIEMAEKDRKYASNTAIGLKAALSVFESELNDKEKESIETFKSNIEPIYLSVYAKHKGHLSSGTLIEYKRRILRLIRDYEQYGSSPEKMASWKPSRRIRGLKNKNKTERPTKSLTSNQVENATETSSADSSVTNNKFELTLRSNVKAIIVTPSDLTLEEATKIKKYIEYLESVSK